MLTISLRKKAQEWIMPTNAKCFQDLEHLHKFDADWVKVEFNQLDLYDPDCVYRIVDNQAYLWCPTDWIIPMPSLRFHYVVAKLLIMIRAKLMNILQILIPKIKLFG